MKMKQMFHDAVGLNDFTIHQFDKDKNPGHAFLLFHRVGIRVKLGLTRGERARPVVYPRAI